LEHQPRTKNQEPRTINPPRRGGFTIIELLAVITLIAMLAALLFGAAQYVVRTARDQQAHTTATALQVAIASYRHEYGQWPIPDASSSEGSSLQNALKSASTNGPTLSWSGGTVTNSSDGLSVTFAGNYNYLVFDQLRATTNNVPADLNGPNPHNVHFIDDSTVVAETSQAPIHNGQCIRRYQLPSGGNGMIEQKHAVVYVPRNGGIGYYGITIWFDLEKCEVDL